ncbi:hypothetical protein C8Q78DRAFT_722185 [Trametes maxima]|nr:hypothetical protein C8Q78DRAFT_722185 [Trametes maxima]
MNFTEAPSPVEAPQADAVMLLPSFDNTAGALLLGTVFGAMLYGVTFHQTYRYFRTFPGDIALLKWMVLILFALETAHTVLTIYSSYYFLVKNFVNPIAFEQFIIAMKLVIPVTGCTTALCQSFYVRRVYMMGSRHRLFIPLALLFMLAHLGFMIAGCIKAFRTDSFPVFLQSSWIISASYGCDVGTDITLAGTLVSILLRSRTGFKKTDATIDVLILYAINTGMATSIFGVLILVFGFTSPQTLIYPAISVVSNKVIANSMLAVLNSRQSLAKRMTATVETMPRGDRRTCVSEYLTRENLGGCCIQPPVGSIPRSPSASDTSVSTLYSKATANLRPHNAGKADNC